MAEYGEVKFKVRRNALLLREFTIAELVRATGLNPESVRTEVQRLKQEEFLVSEHRPGQREALYRLSDDPEKRLAFSRSIEAFYPEPAKPIVPRPTSRLYQAALRSLSQAEEARGTQCEELLKQAEHQLEGAWEAEGASRAPELVQAHILRERGRLVYLQGKRESAQKLLTQAREIFAAADLESEVRLVDEYLVCIEAWRRIGVTRASDAAARARCVLEALIATEYLAISPLVDWLAGLTRELSHTMSARVAGITLQAETHRKITETHEEVKRVREDLRRLEREREPIPMPFREQSEMPMDSLDILFQLRSEATKTPDLDSLNRRRRQTDD
jgi:DNA-binding transcriptional regulator GbsR (MarR family)